MPNYEVIRKFCNFRRKEAVLPATYVAEVRGAGKIGRQIQECLSKDAECRNYDCIFAEGEKDPL